MKKEWLKMQREYHMGDTYCKKFPQICRKISEWIPTIENLNDEELTTLFIEKYDEGLEHENQYGPIGEAQNLEMAKMRILATHLMKKCPDEIISIGEEIGGLPEGWRTGEVEAHPLWFVPAIQIWKERRKMR